MAKYIKCFHCGKKIPFGEFAYHFEYTDVYCSEECYCNSTANGGIVSDKFVAEVECFVYDDDARKEDIIKEMAEHQNAIEEHQKKIAKLLREYESLTIQN